MNERNQNDLDATVKLPAVPVDVEDFDPEKTIVVEDWSQLAMPASQASR
jgi:hypothetical protein